MDLAQFIDTYKEAIAQRVVESYPPLYRPSQNGHGIPPLLRSPLGAQPLQDTDYPIHTKNFGTRGQ